MINFFSKLLGKKRKNNNSKINKPFSKASTTSNYSKPITQTFNKPLLRRDREEFTVIVAKELLRNYYGLPDFNPDDPNADGIMPFGFDKSDNIKYGVENYSYLTYSKYTSSICYEYKIEFNYSDNSITFTESHLRFFQDEINVQKEIQRSIDFPSRYDLIREVDYYLNEDINNTGILAKWVINK